jgi:F-type H+-transporting ATPase subunit alpha
VPAQIAVLLVLTAKLFDAVPLDRMEDAEKAVQEAAASIPADVLARFDTAKDLDDADRKTIAAIAMQALEPFYPKPEAKPKAEPEAKPKPEGRPKGEPKPTAPSEDGS